MRIDRIWAMPNKNTFTIKPIKELINEEMNSGEVWIDPFSNENSPATITNDLNPNIINVNYHLDADQFINIFATESVDGILFDPPFSPRQIKECYEMVGMPHDKIWTNSTFFSTKKDNAARVIRVGGKAICFGWNSNGLGKNRGFELERILLVAHGGAHNDTIVTVERKISAFNK